jgi:hypothetical protein
MSQIEQTEQSKKTTQAKSDKARQWAKKFWYKKWVSLPLILILVLSILLGVPNTRYWILGTFIKRDAVVQIVDKETNIPVSEATVTLAGQQVTTSPEGFATLFRLPVGSHHATASKKYYKDQTVALFVPVLQSEDPVTTAAMEATGRQVQIIVKNKITAMPLENVKISALDTESTTDKEGKTIMVVPANESEVTATLTNAGYNKTIVKIQVAPTDKDNFFNLTPVGNIYFLSKHTGKINVMKSNLDGSAAKVALAATGKELNHDTVLLASPDWKYLVLKAKRDSAKPKLYLINTANDQLTVLDEGDAEFTPVGWHDNYFSYYVTRSKVNIWQPRRQSLKSFNAQTGQLISLDDTKGGGVNERNAVYETFGAAYILDNQIVYTKLWQSGWGVDVNDNDQHMLLSTRLDGSGKHVIKSFPARFSYLDTRLYKPQELYVLYSHRGGDTHYEYENGNITENNDIKDKYYNLYPSYLFSPYAHKTFWTEERDGKSVFFVGDNNGESANELGRLSEFEAYGWFGEDYLLMSKDNSEIYIVGNSKLTEDNKPLKITDYHKPDRTFGGYGY